MHFGATFILFQVKFEFQDFFHFLVCQSDILSLGGQLNADGDQKAHDFFSFQFGQIS